LITPLRTARTWSPLRIQTSMVSASMPPVTWRTPLIRRKRSTRTSTLKFWSVVVMPSETRSVTGAKPPSMSLGTPLSVAVPLPLSMSVSHAGRTDAEIARASPSASAVEIV
jgi:hypothetical protein